MADSCLDGFFCFCGEGAGVELVAVIVYYFVAALGDLAADGDVTYHIVGIAKDKYIAVAAGPFAFER